MKAVRCSEYDIKLSFFKKPEMSYTTAKQSEINPNSPELKDGSADWTEYRKDVSRHTAYKTSQSGLQDQKTLQGREK